ncbi:transferrin-like isoform X2 [Sitophilus oryzae]|uniref:Transferrin-like isoform X2 n=1 Tax=Sitophilus oryzae TaxID=7048 RepID=A0A6J2YYA4_SITOR|nr:transferrin-like isoform X2 [Sitophilus oryzae]
MANFKVLVLFLACAGLSHCNEELCMDFFDRDACQQIGRDLYIQCRPVTSKIDCILKAGRGEPILSILSPEEAVLGAALATSQAVVIGEVSEATYETVVLLRRGLTGSFVTGGLKYCHPGYDHNEQVSKYVLEELERKSISYNCTNGTTLLEQKFQALANQYGSSCRPGTWTEDKNFDTELKNRYSSLCELCPNGDCNLDRTVYFTPFNDSLTCLVNGGDVALTTATYANQFFTDTNNTQNFQYWCPDGTLTDTQCVWTNQTQRVLISSESSASALSEYVSNSLPLYVGSSVDADTTLQQSLARVLGLGPENRINLFTPTSLTQYVSSRREIPSVNGSIQCGLTVNWSVTNEAELNKCWWLQQASVNTGLQPVIDCAQSSDSDTVSNMDNIRSGVGDIAFVDAAYGYIARRKGLTNVAYLETDRSQLSRIVLVVRNDTTWFQENFANLRNRPVCLPEYGGKEWLVLIDTLIQRNAIQRTCDYGAALSDFVGDSCAPGANAKDLDISYTNSDKFCATCVPVSATGTAKYCNADTGNKYYGSEGALRCLADLNGDYAVISLNDLPPNNTLLYDTNSTYRVIARNGSMVSIDRTITDEETPLATITAGEILIRRDNPKYNDVVLLLRSIEKEFGQNLNKPFKVFDKFDNVSDLLFPDSTPGITISGGGNRYVARFQELLRDSESCSTTRQPHSASQRIIPTTISAILVFILVKLFL